LAILPGWIAARQSVAFVSDRIALLLSSAYSEVLPDSSNDERVDRRSWKGPCHVDDKAPLEGAQGIASGNGCDGHSPSGVVYVYAPGRAGKYARQALNGFKGVLQVDGYAGYNALTDERRKEDPLNLALCWAHWRRDFFDINKGGSAPIAAEALKRIAASYQIEIRGRSAEERRAMRQANTAPLIDDLFRWLEQELPLLPQSGKMAEIIRYGLKRRDGLTRFLDDGTIEIDSNTVERAIRPITLNRKNALFAGNDVGASYCSSGYVLIKQRNLAGDCQIADVWIGVPGHRGVRRPAAGRQPELSMVPRHTAAALEVRRRSPFGRLSCGSPSGLQRLR
jgi:hypothetical protein